MALTHITKISAGAVSGRLIPTTNSVVMDDLCYYDASIEHLLLADTHQTSNVKSNSIKLLVIAPTQVVKLQESCL